MENNTVTIKVRIPTPLQKLTKDLSIVESNGSNIKELIDNMEDSYPGIKERLMDKGKIRRFINLYVDDEDIRFKDNLETEITEGSIVSIVPALSGG